MSRSRLHTNMTACVVTIAACASRSGSRSSALTPTLPTVWKAACDVGRSVTARSRSSDAQMTSGP